MRYVQGKNRSQTAPLPVSLDELIPDAPLVRVIDAYVSLLDFTRPKPPDALRTILPIDSNSICTIIFSVFAPHDDSRPNISAM
jgi:hypothetical protein